MNAGRRVQSLTRRTGALLAALASAIAVSGFAQAANGAGGGARAGASIQVSISRAPITRPLPDNFLGLALEFRTVPQWSVDANGHVNPLLIQLLDGLDPTGRPVLRIGGESTDHSWWPASGIPKPLGITYDLTPSWAQAALTLARATDAELLIGLNLESDRPRIPEIEAQQLLGALGRRYIAAFQIGNEPNLYPFMAWYRVLGGHRIPWFRQDGTPVFSRGAGYGPAQFASEFARTLRVIPPLPITGPETSGTPWLQSFADLLGGRSRIRMLTSHAYGLNECVTDRTSPSYPSVPHLLSLTASRTLLGGLTQFVPLAHRFGRAYRIDEMGPVTCDGRPGVSNTMAAALWVLDSLFAVASEGVNGVNLHTYPNNSNGLFDFSNAGTTWSATVHPIYYGALMFSRAAPAGSRLLRVVAGTQSVLRAWATLGRDRRVRVVLINDSLRHPVTATVSSPGGFRAGSATVERLTAPSAYATGAVALGQRMFPTPTTTGVLAPPALETARSHGGVYRIQLPSSSAALVTIVPNH